MYRCNTHVSLQHTCIAATHIDIAQAAACKCTTEIFESAGFKPDEIHLYGKYTKALALNKIHLYGKYKPKVHPALFSPFTGLFSPNVSDTLNNTIAAVPVHKGLWI